MKKKNNSIKLLTFMCFIVCMMCTIQTSPILAQETKNITFSKKLTREEAADFEEPDAFYEDEDGIKYQLTEWELEEKAGEETRVPMEKQVRYLGLEDGEVIPETINAKTPFPQPNLPEATITESQLRENQEETPVQLSGSLHKTEIQTINEQWKDDLYLPVTFYSYGADEFQLENIIISAEADHLLEETAKKGSLILDSLGLSDQAYHITSMVWSGEPFTDEDGQLCRNAIALGERLLKDVEVVYKGEVILKEPDHYELHAVYQAQEVNEESAEELTTQAEPELPISASKKGPFWYLIRTGFVITVAIGIIGILIGIILLFIMKRRKKEEKDHF